MTDMTSSTSFYPTTDPIMIRGKTNASNNDSFKIPYGQLLNCIVNAEDDINALTNATVSGSTVTLTVTDSSDGTTAITVDTDINFIATLRSQ